MKTTIIILLFTVTVSHAFSQIDAQTKEYYVTKSHYQKTAAWVMLGSGTALTTLGVTISKANTINHPLGNSSNNNVEGTTITVIGVASVLGSIPVFIRAAQNKNAALSLSAGLQESSTLHTAGVVTIAQPSLKIKLVL